MYQKQGINYWINPLYIYVYFILCPMAKPDTIFEKITSFNTVKRQKPGCNNMSSM